jgi:hypothetical protein
MRGLLLDDVHLTRSKPHLVIRYGGPGKPTKSRRIRKVPLFGIALEAMEAWMEVRPFS